jgi:hypothetical protein
MRTARFEVLLPTQHNDGTDVEDGKLDGVRRTLVTRFGALSVGPRDVEGIWVHHGRVYRDTLVRFVVDAEDSPENERFFRDLKESLKQQFRQLDVWVTVHPIRVL